MYHHSLNGAWSIDMAIPIKIIPVLEGKSALVFEEKANANLANKGIIDFSEQVKITNKILEKGNMEKVRKTGYEWCLEANIRLLNMLDWDTSESDCEKSYFTEKIDAVEFYRRLELCTVKPNSQPRKTEMYLEYRMYGMVPYQFRNTAHTGIQHGHAVSKYQRAVVGKPIEPIYNKWIDEDVTIIVLNGGTTNNNPERLGSLNKHMIALRENGVFVQDFYEPDLNDALTGIAFLVDERVFNREVYPDFVPETLPWRKTKPTEKQISELEASNSRNYERWVEKIGGDTNAFLRGYLRPLQLA